MYVPKFAFSLAIVKSLNAIERAIGYLEAASLTSEWTSHMQEKARAMEAYHSLHIEGLRLSWNESQRLFTGGEVPDVNPHEARSLSNYKEALEFIGEHAKVEDEPISEPLIREIHDHVLHGKKEAAPGQYRNVQIQLIDPKTKELLFTPPSSIEIALAMKDFVAWLNEAKTLPPVLIAAIAQYQIISLQPFLHGSSLTARLLSQLILYRAKVDCNGLYALSPSYDKNPEAYYEAIKHVRAHSKDLTKWLEYFTESLNKELQELLYEAKLGH